MQVNGLRFGAIFEVKSRPVPNRGETVSGPSLADAKADVQTVLDYVEGQGRRSKPAIPVGVSGISELREQPNPDSTTEISYTALVGTTEEDAKLVSTFRAEKFRYELGAVGSPRDRTELSRLEARLREKQAGEVSYTSDELLTVLLEDRFDLAAGRIRS